MTPDKQMPKMLMGLPVFLPDEMSPIDAEIVLGDLSYYIVPVPIETELVIYDPVSDKEWRMPHIGASL